MSKVLLTSRLNNCIQYVSRMAVPLTIFNADQKPEIHCGLLGLAHESKHLKRPGLLETITAQREIFLGSLQH
jgi:hypothetical protein